MIPSSLLIPIKLTYYHTYSYILSFIQIFLLSSRASVRGDDTPSPKMSVSKFEILILDCECNFEKNS